MKMMNKFVWAVVSVFVLVANAQAQKVEIISNTNSECAIQVDVPKVNFEEQIINGQTFTKIKAAKATAFNEKAEPEVLRFTIPLSIARQNDATYSIADAQFIEYNNINLISSKGHFLRTQSPSDFPFTFNEDIYASNEWYPTNLFSTSKPYIFRQTRGQNIHLNFTQYNPSTKTLRVYTSLKITAKYNLPATENTLTQSLDAEPEIVQALYKNKYVNYDNGNPNYYTALPQQGDMLVICPNEYLSIIQPYVDWKNEKGIRTKLVANNTLVPVAGDTLRKNILSTFIASEYAANNKLVYVQLVGDERNIATQEGFYPSPSFTNFYGDNRYGYLSGTDNYAELMVGRFYAQDSIQLQAQIMKAIAYEKNPNLTGTWLQNFTAVASNDPDGGDDNEKDWEHQRNIADSMISIGNYVKKWELFDGSQGGADAVGNPLSAMLNACIDTGTSFISYTGHGTTNGITTSQYSTQDCDLQTNTNGQWPAMIVVGCKAGNFKFTSFTQCLGHKIAYVHNTNGNTIIPKGTIANAMSTVDQWWEPPMECQDEAMGVLMGARPGKVRNAFGPMMQCGFGSMQDKYNVGGASTIDDGNQMTDTWQIFGDVSVVLFNRNAGVLNCTHANTLFNGNTSFTLTCTEADADLALSYQGKTLATTKSTSGTATFTFANSNLIPGDSVTITATKYNFRPYQKKVEIIGWLAQINNVQQNNLSIVPNPSNGIITISASNEILDVNICDAQGKVVMHHTGTAQMVCVVDASALSNGLYFVQARTGKGLGVQKFVKF
jgi:gingipain R